jgi:uncharacterized protein (DUF362 family)
MENFMSDHILKNAVYVYKLDPDCGSLSDGMAQAGYEFLKALSPDIKKKVVMKPNITVPADFDSGIITHPDFISGMADYLKEIGIESDDIMVAEGGGSDVMDKYYDQGGYTKMARKQGIKLVNLNLDVSRLHNMPDAEYLKEIGIAKTIKENYFINVPKLKTHNLAVTTLCMKNLMGTITPPHIRHLCSFPKEYGDRWHEVTPSGIELREEVLCRRLCDLAKASVPDLNIVEGIVGRDGTAFNHGKNIQTNLVVGGKNTTAVDAVTSYLMGFEPSSIGYLKIALQRGLGEIDIQKIEIFEVIDGSIKPCDDINKYMSRIPFEVLASDKNPRNIPLNKEMLARCQVLV